MQSFSNGRGLNSIVRLTFLVKSHGFLVHVCRSVVSEAGCFHVRRAVDERHVIVPHTLQLVLELSTHGALEPSHVVPIAVDTLVLEPRCRTELFFILSDPFLDCFDRHGSPFWFWSTSDSIDFDCTLSAGHFVRACAALPGHLTKLPGNCPMSGRYHKVCSTILISPGEPRYIDQR